MDFSRNIIFIFLDLIFVYTCAICFNLLQVGHNIYILCHQLAQHNKELAAMLKPSEQNNADPKINKALQYYASHTAQIEVLRSYCSINKTIYIYIYTLHKSNNVSQY